MAIEVACRCGQRFAAPAHLAGQRVPCPVCQSPIDIGRAASAFNPPTQPTLIPVACQCGGQFGAPSHFVGQSVACQSCNRPIYIKHTPASFDMSQGSPAWPAQPAVPDWPQSSWVEPQYPSAD